MPDTQVPHRPRPTRRRLVIAGLFVVGLAAVLAVTQQIMPLRATFWQMVGQPCGEVQIPRPQGASSHDNRAAEACFAQHYAHCQPASLTASHLLGVDTSSTDTFVVEPGFLGPCGLADHWESLVDAGFIRTSGTVDCTGLTLAADGLRVRGCGSLGNRLLPSEG
jgi:hypothetical protein